MQDQQNNSLVDPMGDCSQCLLNLIVFGMATPYLHNGVMEIEDEDKCEVSSLTSKYLASIKILPIRTKIMSKSLTTLSLYILKKILQINLQHTS